MYHSVSEAEVSASIVFLLPPAAAFIAGTAPRADGGRPSVRPGMPMPRPSHARKPFNGFHLAAAPRVLEGER